MTLEEYIQYRTGTAKVPLIVRNMFLKPFVSNSLRSFWNYWNPGFGYFLLFYCYKPLRNIFPNWISLIITFLVCGLAHDILYIAPITIVDGLGFVFPFITVWFLIVAIGILITDFFQIDFRKINKIFRPIFHLGYLGITFSLTRYFDLLLG